MMNLLWPTLLAYVFVVGYGLVRRLESFVRSNPSAFPSSRITLVVPPAPPDNLEGDEAHNFCYNGYSNSKELETHERQDP